MSTVHLEPHAASPARPAFSARGFTLPPHLEAAEPPEARGLARDEVRLMVSYRADDRVVHTHFRALPDMLAPGDLLVVNTSGTMNAALHATRADGTALEMHLSTHLPADLWIVEPRQIDGDTTRPLTTALAPGETLALPGGATATLHLPYLHDRAAMQARMPARLWIATLDLPDRRLTPDRTGSAGILPAPDGSTEDRVEAGGPRKTSAASAGDRLEAGGPRGTTGDRLEAGGPRGRLDAARPDASPDLPGADESSLQANPPSRSALDAYLAAHGFPIRYSYVRRSWPISYYQTVYATEVGSAEMPSAGRAFTPDLLTRLVARGVVVAPLLLHTGVASVEDHEPPYEEFYRVPPETARLVNATHAAGRRVVAVGTTVVRALETVTDEDGVAHPGEGWTRLVITPRRGVRAVTALLTGLHEPRSSHLAMLEAMAGIAHLDATYAEALRQGYLWHEFGDLHLIL